MPWLRGCSTWATGRRRPSCDAWLSRRRWDEMGAGRRLPRRYCSSRPRRNLLPGRFWPWTEALVCSELLGFSRGWIDHQLDFRNAVCGESALSGMLAHHFFVGRDVDTVNFVLSDVAVQPLDLRTQVVQHAAGFL